MLLVRLVDHAGDTGQGSGGLSEVEPAMRDQVSVQGSLAVLDDAARGLVNDAFQRQVLVRQCFKAYVIDSPRWRSLEWLDPEEMGHGACACRLSACLELFHSQSFLQLG